MSRERIARTVRTIGVALVAASVLKELTGPPAEREWHGQLAGFIPYEFRCRPWTASVSAGRTRTIRGS